jgi:multidrug efflux pump subunit AcrA (membrane-fusion protein)
MLFTPHPFLAVPRLGAAALLLTVTAAGCRNNQQGAGAASAPPPSAVKVLTLEQRPVEQASEFIATVRSLRSTTVQPEVEGLVTRIFVKSGDHVRAGAPLIQINADKQQATVRSTEASRAGTEADVQYWRQQV